MLSAYDIGMVACLLAAMMSPLATCTVGTDAVSCKFLQYFSLAIVMQCEVALELTIARLSEWYWGGTAVEQCVD